MGRTNNTTKILRLLKDLVEKLSLSFLYCVGYSYFHIFNNYRSLFFIKYLKIKENMNIIVFTEIIINM